MSKITSKLLMIILIIAAFVACFWLFNHVNPWLAIGLIIVIILLIINQTTKKNEKN